MSDTVKLIIEIPETAYEGILNANKARGNWGNDLLGVLCNGVVAGTPLPKGHGRLGDLDAIEAEMINGIKAGNYEEGYETYGHINNMDDCVECIKFAPTIIEADKAESEDKE